MRGGCDRAARRPCRVARPPWSPGLPPQITEVDVVAALPACLPSPAGWRRLYPTRCVVRLGASASPDGQRDADPPLPSGRPAVAAIGNWWVCSVSHSAGAPCPFPRCCSGTGPSAGWWARATFVGIEVTLTNAVRRHHYVPACYLKHFTVPQDRHEGRLYVYDRERAERSRVSPGVVPSPVEIEVAVNRPREDSQGAYRKEPPMKKTARKIPPTEATRPQLLDTLGS
jgi:hypothetical protein